MKTFQDTGQEVTWGCRELPTNVKKRTTSKSHNSKTIRDIVMGFSLLKSRVQTFKYI